MASHDHPETLRSRAGAAISAGDFAAAERLLRQAVEQAPDLVMAHADLTMLLCRLGKAAEALALLGRAASDQGEPVWTLSLMAAALMHEHRPDDALPVLERLVSRAPGVPIPWINLAHAAQSLGHADRALEAYRRALALDPASGAAWYGIANLRTVPFGISDVAAMETALGRAKPSLDTVQLGLALGHALGRGGDHAASFRRYDQANALRGRLVPYDPDATDAFVRAVEDEFSVASLRPRGESVAATTPIFIVGMPRSGSTLVEQILASHPLVEGLGELFELQQIADEIAPDRLSLMQVLHGMSARDLSDLGERYMAATRRYRRDDKPFFTDKLPANWQLLPLIRLILPNARIVDVRRDPVASCLSTYSTYFNRSTPFPANLDDLGRYYRAYSRLVTHVDRVDPEAIFRLRYEELVQDPETQIRGMLDHVGIEFHGECLHPDRNSRAINTPSSLQVRQGINADGLDRWRPYEPFVDDLRNSLAACAS